MRTILAVTATFAGAFVIVAFTATLLEIWATTRYRVDHASLIADQPMPERGLTPAGFFPTGRH